MNILQGSNWHESYSGLVEMLWSFSSSFFQLGVGPPPQPSRSAADPPPSLVSCQPTSVHWDVKKEPVRQVKVGKRHSMILSSSGRVATFGSGLYHQLGHGQTENEWTPRMVRAFLIVGNDSAACVQSRQLCEQDPEASIDDTMLCPFIHQVDSLEGVGEMLPGMQHQHPHSFHTFIIPLPSTCPTQPCCYSTAVFCADGRFSGLRAIACGGWHCAALSTTGEVYTWGWNRFGQLGCGDRNLSPLPHLLPQVLLTRGSLGGQAKEQEVNFDQVRVIPYHL